MVDRQEIDAFAAELVDRFGPMPAEVENLLEIVAIKRMCRDAGVEKVEAGPKGAVVALRQNKFKNPEKLIFYIQRSRGAIKLRPDQRLVFAGDWHDPAERMKELTRILGDMVKMAA
jgi:transcription-repair coupling factor (superfamily II helicase)